MRLSESPKAILSKTIRELKNLVLRVKQIDREAIASIYLKGSGIEIGALWCPLKVPSYVKVRYVDLWTASELRKQYPELGSRKLIDADIIDNGETLKKIADTSQDFVIANHFLEHCENPIETLANFERVLRLGGIIYLCLPDKRYTFDKKREVTTFLHLLSDYTKGPIYSREEHLRDWVVNVEDQRDETKIQSRIKWFLLNQIHIHYHVWTQKEMFEFLSKLREQIGLHLEIQLFLRNKGEAIFILRKERDSS
jgi:predicted SAM-dependent methyltransferase